VKETEMKRSNVFLSVLFAAMNCLASESAVRPEEMKLKDDWVRGNLSASDGQGAKSAGLRVLANNDAVDRNSRGGKPLRIADKEYTRGLYCHAVSKVVVNLPSPGRTFTSVAGIDSNSDTRPGRGSVVFSVLCGGKTVFKSDLMREGMPGVVVNADLAGATSFILEISDGGDGISCDQSDWADAKVVLENGKELWLGELPFDSAGSRPFSFVYGDQHSEQIFSSWPVAQSSRELDKNRTEVTLTWTDPKTGLQVRCVAVDYRDFPAIEWTLYFKNTGRQDTPVISDIQALDAGFQRGQHGEFLLHHFAGSQANSDDYRPLEMVLHPRSDNRFSPHGGWSSSHAWPYYNLEWGGQGVIIAIGWPGKWLSKFQRDDKQNLRIAAGQEVTRFKLLPDEEVRSPLMALVFWKGGDWIRAQNIWRRWLIAHNMPRPGGKLPPPMLCGGSSGQFNEMTGANEENQKLFIKRYLDNGVKIDFWWMDAGWYVNKTGWPNVGTWEVDRVRFPSGLRAITDYAHSRGTKALVWFEPERVTPGTWIYENKKEWLLGADGNQKLLYYGIPEAHKWMSDHVLKLMKDEGIDIYRQDFNFGPIDYWRNNDAPDRKGITEIKHCTGYLAYWDELRRGNPDMLTDECASGGRRNDLESMRRAVPLHKSDMNYGDREAKHTQFYGLAMWNPYFATGIGGTDAYSFRTGYACVLGLGFDMRRDDLDFVAIRRYVDEWREVAVNYYGDFYPLTAWHYGGDAWMAWQFDRPEEGQGVVQAFREPRSPYTSAQFKLRGLEEGTVYTVRNHDEASAVDLKGADLMNGLSVVIRDKPGAAVISYRRK
jgi:alpha-galactosidase